MKNDQLITEVKKYAQGMNCQPDVFEWIEKHLVAHLKDKELEQSEIEHILDYLASDKRPKITVGYEGIDLEADVEYRLDKEGKFVKCE